MSTRRLQPIPLFLEPGAPCVFPDPNAADRDGLVAIGGDLTQERLLTAYRSGIFPCYGETTLPLWWSPSPRAIATPERLHVARRLARTLRHGGFRVTWNRAFRRVMYECGEERRDGRWILPEMIDAYVGLHRDDHAHSIEVWHGGRLVGGLYGVQIGRLFAAESMFRRVDDASKIAFVSAVRTLFAAGIQLFDVQYPTRHLTSLGVFTVPRATYLERARRAASEPLDLVLPRSEIVLDDRRDPAE